MKKETPKRIRQTRTELVAKAKELNLKVEAKETKAELLDRIERAQVFDGEILEDEKTIVKEMAANFAEPEFIARKLNMDLDTFNKKYETVMADAICERALGYSRMMHDLAISGDFKALKILFEKMHPKENTVEIIGGKNKRMVTVKQKGVEDSRPLIVGVNVLNALDTE